MKILYTLSFLIGSVATSIAQTTQIDSAQVHSLDEFVLSATQSLRMRKQISQPVQSISEADIQKNNARSTAELLSDQGNVHVQKSQQGGGSPVLWGFEANKVLLVVDGVRMNNLIYRGGHLQNVITLDQFMLDKVEVLYGPSSVMYGSDALGGVINFYSRGPKLSGKAKTITVSPSAGFRMGSANKEITGHAALNIAGNKFGSYTAVTYSKFGDLKMGEKINPAVDSYYFLRKNYIERVGNVDSVFTNDNPYVQKNSGYNQIDIFQKFLYQPGVNTKHTLNIQHSNSSDVPRYDRLTDVSSSGKLRYADWYYGPQKRTMAAYSFESKGLSFTDKFTTTLSFQDIEESRHDRSAGNANRNSRTENVQVVGLTAFAEDVRGKHLTQIGVDGQLNFLKSTAVRTNLVTGATSPLDTRYPDGKNAMHSISVFANDIYTINEHFNVNGGLRLGYVMLSATLKDSLANVVRLDDIHQNNFTYSFNLGLNYLPNPNNKISVGVGSGYRVPNIDDLSKIFETAPGTLIVPNPNLRPEQTVTSYLGYTFAVPQKHFLSIAGYYTRMFNGIITRAGQYNGADTFYSGTEAYQVLSNQNARKAYVTGFTINGNAQIIDKLFLTAAAQYTYGRIVEATGETPLDHIPPFTGKLGLGYYHKRFNADVYGIYNAWKRMKDYNLDGEDNQRYATADGMPSWYTLNFKATIMFNKFYIQPGIENILDMQYRTAFSGINGQGRNFYLALKYNL